ncbi:hypothetical protein GCM10009837_66360 [Streptomyces durmitorensis]
MVSTNGNEVVECRACGQSCYASCSMRRGPRNRFDMIRTNRDSWAFSWERGTVRGDGRGTVRGTGKAGRLRASPEPTVPWVTGLLSPAVRSRLWSEVPRHTRSVRLIAPAEPRVVFPCPPLAGTDIGTNEAAPRPVTRRTGESGPELRSGGGSGGGAGGGSGGRTRPPHSSQTRPLHSSRSVIASDVPGLPSASL